MEPVDLEPSSSQNGDLVKVQEFSSDKYSRTMPTGSFGHKHDDDDDKTLHLSFQQLSNGCSKLLETLFHGRSPTLDACRGSLQTDMNSMLHEANLLLKNMEFAQWRASLAQSRVVSYLETIQSAFNSRHQLDRELGLVSDSIATQMRNNTESKTSDDLAVRVSSWRTPSLCFDLDVSEPVQFIRTDEMPIKVRARGIAEIYAKDMPGSIPQYNACNVHIEQVKHETSNTTSIAGTAGEAFIKIRVCRLGGAQKKIPTWGEDEDIDFVRVKEARVVQSNAFLPMPKRTVDMFTSSHYGSSDVTVTLRFKTHRLLKSEDMPEVNIELVMASS